MCSRFTEYQIAGVLLCYPFGWPIFNASSLTQTHLVSLSMREDFPCSSVLRARSSCCPCRLLWFRRHMRRTRRKLLYPCTTSKWVCYPASVLHTRPAICTLTHTHTSTDTRLFDKLISNVARNGIRVCLSPKHTDLQISDSYTTVRWLCAKMRSDSNPSTGDEKTRTLPSTAPERQTKCSIHDKIIGTPTTDST